MVFGIYVELDVTGSVVYGDVSVVVVMMRFRHSDSLGKPRLPLLLDGFCLADVPLLEV
jgi:hypothetical protein